jgi:hypothetical protein
MPLQKYPDPQTIRDGDVVAIDRQICHVAREKVRDNVISFEASGRPCEIRFLTPVAGDGKAWNLYVMHDPAFLAKQNQRANLITGTGRLDELVP